MHRRVVARALAIAVIGLVGPEAACTKERAPTPTPVEDRPPASAAANPSASASPEAPKVPTLVLEKFPGGDGHLHAVEGALMVENEFRIGRIVGEAIEWVGKVPPSNAALGPNRIESVHGRWPDGIGVVYSSSNGRAPSPTYQPLTGVGIEYTSLGGYSIGRIFGVARLGESTVIAANSVEGVEIVPVRGTAKRALATPEEAGCKPGEVDKRIVGEPPAMTPAVVASTPRGTLVSIGRLCDVRGPAAEVWDGAGKSRFVDLSRFWKKLSWSPRLLAGSGDELFAYSDRWAPILRYAGGEVTALPDLERPVVDLFVSAAGVLHANDGATLHRWDGARWLPIGHLAVPDDFGSIAMDAEGTLWVTSGGIHRLRPSPGAAAPAPPPCDLLVHLYEVDDKNDKAFTFPSTRKALSTFSEAISLVEFSDAFRRHLAVPVSSKEQGAAVIAHLKAAMPDETPAVRCFALPKDARRIAIEGSK